jgi:hypothetical protein
MRSVLDHLSSTVDRFQEAHFYLHQMEGFYHDAEPFRYSLNSFIRALKEVPLMISMELQNHPGFAAWYRPVRATLNVDALISHFSEQRDFIVHRGMLKPQSKAIVGIGVPNTVGVGSSATCEGNHFRAKLKKLKSKALPCLEHVALISLSTHPT